MSSTALKARVLVVDDVPRSRRLLSEMLTAQGHVPIEAAGGQEALARVAQDAPDLILLDVTMPGIDGYEVLKVLKTDPSTRSIPVVLVTALNDEESWRQGIAAGASELITKPVDRVRLGLRLRNILMLKHYHDEALRHEEELRTAMALARDAALAASQAQSDFLAAMSHEIRTPMTGVMGMLELLDHTQLDASQRTSIQIVRESGNSLMRIIDDILDFSKIEAGKMDIRPQPASLGAVLDRLEQIYGGQAAARGLQLSCHLDPHISPVLWIDTLRLRQILHNFLSNALKFTTRGSVAMEARLMSRAEGHESVEICVRDTGKGISAENQAQLFQPFSQGGVLAARQWGGTGLGLAICRRLAGLMGGSVEMTSELGQGTTLSLRLPMAVAAGAVDVPEPSEAERSKASGASGATGQRAPAIAQAGQAGQGASLILVVDDHPTNRAVLARQLAALGYACETAPDGVLALEMFRSGRFAMVLADCHMPLMDGYELARRIRGLEAEAGAVRKPIVACTAIAGGSEEAICLAAGMDDCLTKPLELAVLGEALHMWLPLPLQDSAQAPAADQPPLQPALLDTALITATWGSDSAAVREILANFQRFNDEDANLLRRSMDSGDLAQVKDAAHRMLGSSKMVGASDFAAACERLQTAAQIDDWVATTQAMQSFEVEAQRLNEHLQELIQPSARVDQ